MIFEGNAGQIGDANNRINMNAQNIQGLTDNYNNLQNSQMKFLVETEWNGQVLKHYPQSGIVWYVFHREVWYRKLKRKTVLYIGLGSGITNPELFFTC